MKYKIILKTSSVNSHRVELCLNTWLKDLDYVCITDIPTGRFNEISGSKRTDYYSAEEKTVHLINLVKDTNQFDEYDWLVFIDDDAILNTKMFNYIIEYLDKNSVYGLKISSGFEKALNLIFPSGGAGYFISPQLIKQTNRIIDNKWGIEDVSVGKWIKDNKLSFQDCFYIDNIKYYLRLNGWFPFDEEKAKEQVRLNKVLFVHSDELLDSVVDHDKKRKDLLTCVTHHYIRTKSFMDYVHQSFITWTPADLEMFKVFR